LQDAVGAVIALMTWASHRLSQPVEITTAAVMSRTARRYP
jgi:hypothetical protein